MALYGVAASAAGLAPTISSLAAPTIAAAATATASSIASPLLLAQFSAAAALSLLVASAALSQRYGGSTAAAAAGGAGGDKVRMVYQGVPPLAGASGSVTGNCQLLLLMTYHFSETGMCEVVGQV